MFETEYLHVNIFQNGSKSESVVDFMIIFWCLTTKTIFVSLIRPVFVFDMLLCVNVVQCLMLSCQVYLPNGFLLKVKVQKRGRSRNFINVYLTASAAGFNKTEGTQLQPCIYHTITSDTSKT